MKHALQWGLKLKAMDQDILKEANFQVKKFAISRLERSQRKKDSSREPQMKDAIFFDEVVIEDEGNETTRCLDQAVKLKQAPTRKVHSAFKYVSSIKNLAQMKSESEKSQTLMAKTCNSGF